MRFTLLLYFRYGVLSHFTVTTYARFYRIAPIDARPTRRNIQYTPAARFPSLYSQPCPTLIFQSQNRSLGLKCVEKWNTAYHAHA